MEDSMSHHSSIQGESDSETEILSSINTQLHSLLSSDSSDGAGDLEDGDTFEAVDRPVFLTARGLCSVIPGQKVSPSLLSSLWSFIKDVCKYSPTWAPSAFLCIWPYPLFCGCPIFSQSINQSIIV